MGFWEWWFQSTQFHALFLYAVIMICIVLLGTLWQCYKLDKRVEALERERQIKEAVEQDRQHREALSSTP